MANDPETTHYYVRGTDPTNNEQIAFSASAWRLPMRRRPNCEWVATET